MLKDIAILLGVQEKERELLVLGEEKARLPVALEEVKRRIEEAENGLGKVKEDLESLQLKKKDFELDSESKLIAIAKYDKQLYLIKSNVEYQALQKEIAECKVDNSRIEDKILEVMEKIEEGENLRKSRDEDIKRGREQLAEEEKRVAKEMASLSERISLLESERDKILPDISEPVLRKYQRIFRNKRDTAIVPLVNYTCGGCYMILPPQVANNVRKGTELVICENCSRILYWPEGVARKAEVL